MDREKLKKIIFYAALLVLLIIIGIFAVRGYEAVRDRNLEKQLQEQYYDGSGAGESENPDLNDDVETLTIQDDFLELYEQNSDIVGWLTAGDIIDNPVVQRDNDFYLHHNFNQESDSTGTVFLNECNSLFPRDDVILLHAHALTSGAMFGKLKKFESYDYAAEYPVLSFRTIYDAEDVYYTPIAVFNASMMEDASGYFDVLHVLFEDDEPADENAEGRQSSEFQDYLDSLAERRLWEPKTDVNVNDKLMALLTCSYYHDDGRLIVVCRALREDETPESIMQLYAEE